MFDNVTIVKNGNLGVRIDTTSSTNAAGHFVQFRRSHVDLNENGIVVVTPAGTSKAQATLVDSSFSFNVGGYGIGGNGSFTRVRVTNSVITGNNDGLKIANGAIIISYQDNLLFGNVTDGTFSSTSGKQ